MSCVLPAAGFKVNLRAANRGYFDPLRFSSSFGFRCAKNAPRLMSSRYPTPSHLARTGHFAGNSDSRDDVVSRRGFSVVRSSFKSPSYGRSVISRHIAGLHQEAPQYPDQALLLCESAADCPSDWECLPCPEERRTIDGCPADAQFCSCHAPAACVAMGNLEAWEACDDGNTQDGDAARRSVTKPIPAVMAWSMLSLARSVMMGRSDAYNLDGAEIVCGKSTGPQPSCGDSVLQEEEGESV